MNTLLTFHRVTDYEESNQMTAESLATVFSPNLLRSADDDVGFFFANMSAAHRAMKILITHVRLFLTLQAATDVALRDTLYSATSSRISMLITTRRMSRNTTNSRLLYRRKTRKSLTF